MSEGEARFLEGSAGLAEREECAEAQMAPVGDDGGTVDLRLTRPDGYPAQEFFRAAITITATEKQPPNDIRKLARCANSEIVWLRLPEEIQ